MPHYTGDKYTQILPRHVRDELGEIGSSRIADLLGRAVGVGCLEELLDARVALMRAHWGFADADVADLERYVRSHPGTPAGWHNFHP